jgi:hypothetical protein
VSCEFVTVQPRQTRRVLMSEGEGEKFFLKKKQVIVWEEEKFLPRTNQISHKNCLFLKHFCQYSITETSDV